MPYHKVKQGEDIKKILKGPKYGMMRISKVLNDPKNAHLFKDQDKERDAAILNPGDEFFIPEKELGEESGQTDQRHRFRLKRQRKLILIIKNADGEPFSYEDYKLKIDGEGDDWIEGTTDGEGRLEQNIALDSEEGELHIAGHVWPISVAHLDPITTVSGVQARLNNLGFNAGPVDGKNGPKTKAAVKRFQKSRDITVDGIVGPQTRKHLKDAYGC